MFARTRLLAPLRSFSTAGAEPSFDKGKFSVHFRLTPSPHPLNIEKTWNNPIGHQVWTNEEVASVQNTHRKRQYIHDYIAFGAIKTLRWAFDTATRYNPHAMSESKWLTRMIMLETVAGVPGMAGGMLRHLRSLRRMKRDHGWIHTLLEEAENERMHLLTFLELKKPSYPLRFAVLGAQGIFMNAFFLAYLIYPKVCHRFVGYLEEEAVRTYTHCLRDIDEGKVWNGVKAPEIAIAYWKLKADATMKDVILAIRADEANHRDVNHTFASLDGDDYNPLLLKELDKQNKTETQSH